MVSAKKGTITTWLDCHEKRCAGSRVCLSACLLLGWVAGDLRAEDWPQWRGVDRAAVWNDTGVVARFPDDGLTVTWRAPVRAGFAGPAVAGGRVFVLDYQTTPGTRTMNGQERLVVFDEETGAELWQRQWPATYRNLLAKFRAPDMPFGPRRNDGVRLSLLSGAKDPKRGLQELKRRRKHLTFTPKYAEYITGRIMASQVIHGTSIPHALPSQSRGHGQRAPCRGSAGRTGHLL